MRLLQILSACGLAALSLTGLASGQSAEQIQKLSSKDADGIAKFDIKSFMQNVVPEGKDYSVVVQLTALAPRYKCEPCKEVDSTLRAVSRGWKKRGEKGRIVFGTLDVEDGEQLFSQMGIDKIPRVMIFPADKGPHALKNPSPRELNLGARTISPEGMAARLTELFGVEIKPDIPVDYSKHAMKVATAVAGAYALYLIYKHISLSAIGRNVWAVGSILFVLVMTSGFMWNRINDPPYMGQARNGDPMLFAPTNQQQFSVETQIIAASYAICALCIVGLVRHVPRIQNQDQKTFVTFVFVVALVMTFSYINSVFRIKFAGYPYRLLLA
ncbi:oligosaccharyl transferase subunit ost3/OST6 [Dipsacomyces acuminosporus]|nr:oligosaccharyl transferase subunit ost3/OST6 [Dipsacomyces acuminosporus]